MIDEMAAPVEKPASPVRSHPSAVKRRAGCVGLLVIAPEHAGRAGQHLAVIGDADVDARKRPADGVRIGLAVGLQASSAAASVAP